MLPHLNSLPVSAPLLDGNEKKYVNQCLDEGWISSAGRFISRFETEFAEYCGVRHGVACCNGTAALHLALMALGIGPGDEVILPTLTFVATANVVLYVGAQPVLAESDAKTWNMDPAHVESLITPRTRAILVVHLYGQPAEMDALTALARKHGLALVEDASEAHGAEYHGRRAGALGDISTFSFYGNKTLTTGEGGMCLTNDATLAQKMRLLCNQGKDPTRQFWFSMVGYNFRMTNVAAAIGVAQLERVEQHLAQRCEVFGLYRQLLSGAVEFQGRLEDSRAACWLFTALFPSEEVRDRVAGALAAVGIDTRVVFFPMHLMPPYEHLAAVGSMPIAERISRRGLSLPTSAQMGKREVKRVCEAVWQALG